jgi:hypothetical protein
MATFKTFKDATEARLDLVAEFRELRDSFGPLYSDWGVEPLLRHAQGLRGLPGQKVRVEVTKYSPHESENQRYGQVIRDLYRVAGVKRDGAGTLPMALSTLMERHSQWQEEHRYQRAVPSTVALQKEWLPKQEETAVLLRLTGLGNTHATMLMARICSLVNGKDSPKMLSSAEELTAILTAALHLFLPGREWHRPELLSSELPLYELRWRPAVEEYQKFEMSKAVAIAKRTGTPLEFGYSSPRPSAEEPARRVVHVKRMDVLERQRTFFVGRQGAQIRTYAFRHMHWAHCRPTLSHWVIPDPYLYLRLTNQWWDPRASLLTFALGPLALLQKKFPEMRSL